PAAVSLRRAGTRGLADRAGRADAAGATGLQRTLPPRGAADRGVRARGARTGPGRRHARRASRDAVVAAGVARPRRRGPARGALDGSLQGPRLVGPGPIRDELPAPVQRALVAGDRPAGSGPEPCPPSRSTPRAHP